MPRARREHEEHLEAIEPIGVVVLNDVAYLMEDVSEIILDMAKLMRNRGEDVAATIGGLSKGAAGLAEALPAELLGMLMGTVFELGAKAQELRAEVSAEDGEGASTPIGNVDPRKLKPEALEAFGQLLQAKAHEIEGAIETFEKKVLQDNPPPA